MVQFEAVEKVPISEFLPALAFDCADAPNAVLEHAVRMAADRLCSDSNILRRTVHVHTLQGVHNYRLDTVDDVRLLALMGVTYRGGNFCTGKPVRSIVEGKPCWCGPSKVWISGGEICFSQPHDHDCYDAEISVKPGRNACELDAVLYDTCLEVILNGARAVLYDQPGRPWSNVQRAQACQLTFEQQIRNAAVTALLRHQRGVIHMSRRIL